MQSVVIHTDGASRGNPGPASVGIVFYSEDGDTVFEHGEVIGNQTNNYAEYTAVIRALTLALEKGFKGVTVKTDSELLVRQVVGQYKVKSEVIRPLFNQVRVLSGRFENFRIEHVRREFNHRADELANQALDNA
ncbi:MAG: ribonuclease H [Bdellovibrionales bacterium CG10_big_fil_rev_8_21_14_0_10_45_34]|nr:MAG: ribonuclease H [Bdellovibrionales bacterium CG10_big_fil_rev_8_21_14_0_10_45_34]